MVKQTSRRGKVSFLDYQDIEYTEIKPIRPNQSVILAGLGIQGRKVPAWHKDRGYRSTQGAGYSDGLVLHSARPRTQQGWPAAKQVIFHISSSASGEVRSPAPIKSILASSQDGRRAQDLDEVYQSLVYKHLDTISRVEDGGLSRLEVSWTNQSEARGKDEKRSRSCSGGRLSARNTASSNISRPSSRTSRPTSRASRPSSRTLRSGSRASRPSSRASRPSSRTYHHKTLSVQSQEQVDDSDDELSILGDSIVRESLNHVLKPEQDSDSDLTELAAELLASDLRDDQFTEIDYIRSGLAPNSDAFVEKS
ncbi:uncharacterized protein LOC111718183 isoform X2 [Eurytemora carolleeae]|uniref:uncharacterized protein LOC111718183 isoform X2 n=1 Tax=Eurytemora carolleeae TaxID=1294199 RepID=UPI000C77960F|nr:uncharacterized protein LOC111718183 isoform X2 [Eurytemora carolleeae]|eukprot:XP_023349478.1 uncharacterized protein LOC111718183 isoform X2 [Eurytemora affinis]